MTRNLKTAIGLGCCAVSVLTEGRASAQNPVLNPGFETAGTSSSLAADWTLTQASGGPVYGVRTNDNPHSGSYNYEVHLASTGAGPLVEFAQSSVAVIGGAAYTFSFYSDRLAGSAGDSDQYNIQWFNSNSVLVGQTGYTSYTPGANVYAQTIVTGLASPATAVTAGIFLHCAGAAVPSQSATIDFDDVSLATTNVISGGGGGSGNTNTLLINIVRGVNISWFASNSVLYQVQWASSPGTNAIWNNLGSRVSGNGATNAAFDPSGPPHNFYQVLSIQ
jgi:hypothetical protein